MVSGITHDRLPFSDIGKNQFENGADLKFRNAYGSRVVKNRNFEAPEMPTFLPESTASCYAEKSIRLNNNHKMKR